jgi:hypothetical protein
MNQTLQRERKTVGERTGGEEPHPFPSEHATAGTLGQFSSAVLMFWVVNVTFFLYYFVKSGWVHLAASTPQ